MVKYITAETAAKLLGISPRAVRKMCIEGRLPGARKRNGQWEIPNTADERLIQGCLLERGIDVQLAGFNADKVKEAKRRLGLVLRFEERAADRVRNGGTRTDALELYAAENGINTRTLKRWIKQCKEHGTVGLVDMRGGNRFGSETISEEAVEVFRDMYLTEQRLSIRLCLRNLGYINKTGRKGWVLPSLRVMQYYIKKYIPEPVRILCREGRRAYNDKCAPYNQVDNESIEPGQVWHGDHYQFNCWIRHRNRWIRPWLTAWMDMKSRMLTGWRICYLPNQTTILVATRRAIEKHGPPDMVKIDNGKDYDSEMFSGMTKKTRKNRKVLRSGYLDEDEMTGLYGWMGIRASFAIPYNARSKRIERLFATIDSQFDSTFETYCGKDVPSRPEDINKVLRSPEVIASALSLEEFAGLFDKYAKVYNNTIHAGEGMNGRTPAEVMSTRTSKRAILRDVLDMLLNVWCKVKVGKNGVRVNGIYYGQYDMKLFQHFGKDVLVSYNPDDLSYVTVYDAQNKKRICMATENRFMGYGENVSEEDLREGQRQQRLAIKFCKSYVSSSRKANMSVRDLSIEAAREKTKPEPKPKPKQIRVVKTFLDDQVEEHKREVKQLKLKKAVGAESFKQDLDIDFEALAESKRQPYEDIDLGLPELFEGTWDD